MIKQFECTIENWYKGEPLVGYSYAETASKARYQFYRSLDSDYPYSDFFKDIKTKVIGKFKISQLFNNYNIEDFDKMKKYRNIDFIYQGMKINVCGKDGIIVGYNSGMNLDVVFNNNIYTDNCHPHWETTYYDINNKIIKCFKK